MSTNHQAVHQCHTSQSKKVRFTTEQLDTVMLGIARRSPESKQELDDYRRAEASALGINQPPNQLLLTAYHRLVEEKKLAPNEEIEHFLRKANIRSMSGIAIVTSLVKPYMCPGECVYCPTEVRMPKSYIASEPAAARSLRLDFDPYELMRQRIIMLEGNGHPCDKIEYITKGGTWNAYTLKYQYWYMLESFRACNDFVREHPAPRTYEDDWKSASIKELQEALAQEQRFNETAKHRIIGVTLETRPDAISPKTIHHMRLQGCTRIELGLQATDDNILDLIKRGHSVDDFRRAMYMLRMAGFKVDLHFMPDLPGTTPAHDIEMYKEIFDDPALRPDMIKIYPNTVIPSAELYQWFLDGRYTPYGPEALFDALLEMKRYTPRYCRISRLIRDIPEHEIKAGNMITNLRQDLEAALAKNGERCVCLRCRELGRQIKHLPKDATPQLFVDEYETVGGKEFFITYEDANRQAVYGFLRLRIPTELPKHHGQIPPWAEDHLRIKSQLDHLMPEVAHAAFIRELHTYGQLVGIGETSSVRSAAQHRGLGKGLVAEAERIAHVHGATTLAVISGVGVRGYYNKLGYETRGTYVVKDLT